jgi:hypothetical protein
VNMNSSRVSWPFFWQAEGGDNTLRVGRSAETKVVRWGMRSNLGPNLTLPVDLPVCADPISIAKAMQEVVALVLHLHQVGQETFTHAGHTTKPLTR